MVLENPYMLKNDFVKVTALPDFPFLIPIEYTAGGAKGVLETNNQGCP